MKSGSRSIVSAASWGVRIEHYTNINVIAPHAIKEVHVNAAGAPRRGIIRHARTGRGTVRGLTTQHNTPPHTELVEVNTHPPNKVITQGLKIPWKEA